MEVGDVLLGRYRLERELGRGGMGRVLAARHLELDELVAIKLILPQHARNEEVVGRFMREAKAAARIRSEHVVHLMDVGRLPTGEPFMVMEMLEGQDLEKVLIARGQLPMQEAVDYVLQALEAVAEAHAAGIVHRDLKPANMFLTHKRSGAVCVKLLDFGISKIATGEVAARGALTQGMIGSPLYMSPEQFQSAKDVGPATDIWAMGVVLFELLTNAHPFMADTMPQLVARVLAGAPPSLRAVRPDLHPTLDSIVARCLEKSADARFTTAADLAAALAPFASPTASSPHRSFARPLLATPPAKVAPLESSTMGPFGHTRADAEAARLPKSSLGLLVSLVAAAGILGTAAFLYLSRPGKPAEHPEPAPAATATPAPSPSPTLPVPVESVPSTAQPTVQAPTAPPIKTTTKPTSGTPKKGADALPVPGGTASTKPTAAAPGPNCNPPYTIDELGRHKAKKECL